MTLAIWVVGLLIVAAIIGAALLNEWSQRQIHTELRSLRLELNAALGVEAGNPDGFYGHLSVLSEEVKDRAKLARERRSEDRLARGPDV